MNELKLKHTAGVFYNYSTFPQWFLLIANLNQFCCSLNISIDYEWAVKLNRFSLSAICLWPAEEQDIRKQFWIKLRTMAYFLLITFVCTIPCLYALIKECDTLMEVTDNLAYSIPLTITVIKFIIVSSKKEGKLALVKEETVCFTSLPFFFKLSCQS